jgi:mannosyltransferase
MKGTVSTIESHRGAPFLLLLSATALLRVVLALHPGIWADEIFSLAMATGHSLEHPANEANPALGDYVEPEDPKPPAAFRRYMEHDTPPAGPGRVIRAVRLSDTSPPLYYLLLNVWSRLVGTSDAALRLFSAFWAIACIPVLWSIGLQLGNRRTAVAACAFFCFSPLGLYYSTEGRMYSLVWFVAVVLLWSTLVLQRRGGSFSFLAVWVLSAVSGLLTHYYFLFVLLACASWLFLYPGKLSRVQLAIALVVTAMAVFPWYVLVPGLMKAWRVTGKWAAEPLAWRETLTNPVAFAWSYLSISGIWGGSGRGTLVAVTIYGFFALLTLLYAGKRLLREESPRLLSLLVLGAVVGPVVVDLAVHGSRSFQVRYGSPGLPGAILLMAFAVSSFPRKAYVAVVILIPLIWLAAVRKILWEPSRSFEPFPEASAQVDTWAKSKDLIIAHSIPSGVLGIARYMTTDTPILSWVPQLGQRRVPDDMERFASAYDGIVLVKTHDLHEPSPAEEWLSQNEILQLQTTLEDTDTHLFFFSR